MLLIFPQQSVSGTLTVLGMEGHRTMVCILYRIVILMWPLLKRELVVTTTTKADSISTTGATLLATPAPTLSAATVTQTVTFSNTAVRSISTTSTLATTVTAATTVTKILVGTTAASGTILAPGMTLLVLMLFSMAMGALVLL